MVIFLIALMPVALVLLASEILWRRHKLKGELARKFIHILAGVYIAFWPLYLSFEQIAVLGAVALTLLVVSRFTHMFHAIYTVKRKTYGELFFAGAIILCAVLAKADWIFTTAILFMSLADGGAAIAGKLWGAKNQYHVFGKKELLKSRAGTFAYIVLAYVSLGVGWFLGGNEVMKYYLPLVLLVLPLGATFLENISPYGLDDAMTPLYIMLVLNQFIIS
jgi:phytol kinase